MPSQNPQSHPNLRRTKSPRRCVRCCLFLSFATILPAAQAQDFSQTQTIPTTPLIDQANDALARSDFPTALKLLTTLNARTPNDPQVLYDLGLTTEALAEEPASGSSHPATVNLQPATSYYQQSIAADPLFPPPHVALGLLLARTNHPAEARRELLTATTLPAAPALKARALRALARLDETANPSTASTELLSALNLTPEEPADILLSAEIAEATPDLPAAEQAYRRYLALQPAGTDATAALAHVLLAQRHPAEAQSLLAAALAAHPGDPTLTSQLAAALLASGEPAQVARAQPLMEALHAAHPQDANITRLLGRIYVETGQPEQADTLYASLLAAPPQPPDPTLLTDRAEVLLRLHRPAAAETLLKQAVANPAGFPTPTAFAEAATRLAFAASEIDDPKEALQALALRSTVLPPSPSSLFLEATANDTLHQGSKAVDLYHQFLAAAHGDYPDEEKQARQRLAILHQKK